MRSVALTGASGFIGSHIAEELIRQQIPTRLFVRRRNRLIDLFEKKGAEIYKGTGPNDFDVLKASLREVDTIIHCAAATKAVRKRDYVSANVGFTKNILRFLKKTQKFVLISSQAAAGPSGFDIPIEEKDNPHPVSHYGRSKLLAEEYTIRWGQENNNNYLILRPCSVYGPGERDFYLYFRMINKGFFILVGCGKKKLSIIHVSDLVNAVLTAAKRSPKGETYFISSDKAYSWEEVGTSIKEALNKDRLLKLKLPESFAYPSALFFDTLSHITRKPFLISRQKVIEMKQSSWICSNRKIREALEWKQEISLKKGVEQTAEWYIENGWI